MMRKIAGSLLSWIVLAGTVSLAAAAANPSEQVAETVQSVERYVEQAIRELDIPGASLALVHDGDIVHTQAWGVTGGDRRVVTVHTPFLIGSNSKAVTVYGVLKLVQDGEVELDAPVRRYVPWFTLADEAVASQITVKQLISHSSGLSAESGFKIADRGAGDDEAVQRIVRELAMEEVAFAPGEGYEYGAANYAVLAALIESVTNMSFADYMETYVYSPLEMKNAAANADQAALNGWQPGYQSWFGLPVASRVPYDNGGASYGYMTASAEDMARWLAAIQKPGAVLDSAMTELSLEPIVQTGASSSYGYGWRVSALEHGGTKIWHGGSTADYRSEVFLLPESGWAAVLLTNRGHVVEAARLTQVADGIVSILTQQEVESPARVASFERWGMSVLTVLLLAGTVQSARKLRRGKPPLRLPWLWMGAAVILLLAAVVFLPALLGMLGIPWRSFTLFAPDLALLAVVTVVLLTANGVLIMLMSLRSKRR